MNRDDVIRELAWAVSRHEAEHDVWVIAGAAMALHGLRERTNDIDLCCSSKHFDAFAFASQVNHGYQIEQAPFGGRMVHLSPVVTLFEETDDDREVEIIAGFRVQTLRGLYEWKTRANRPKDQDDIGKLRLVYAGCIPRRCAEAR